MVLCSSFTSHEHASRAAERLLAAGLPGDDVRVLMGEPERDAGTSGQGSFAGTATGRRIGTFADADREIVTSYPDGVAHMRVAGHRAVLRLLQEAGLDEATARRDADALHHGRILVLVDAGDRDPAAVRAALDQVQESSARVAQ
jgi:hypothetical protein